MNSNSPTNDYQPNNNILTHQTKKIPEKSLKEGKSPTSSLICPNPTLNYAFNSIKKTNTKTSNKISKTQKPKNIKNKYLFSLEYQAFNNLKKKYNFTEKKYNLLCVNHLLSNATCRLVSIFKEKMIIDYIDEFLKRKYNFKECKERIPKFYLYYKHYSIFFGQPFFTDFTFNVILQKTGERKARIYYKNHYQNGESKDDDNENIGFAESGSDDEEEDKNSNNDTNKKKKNKNNNNTIFSNGIKENIDNVTVMTTINSIENNTINLGLNNERIEIFSENKMEKSNDTTIGELMDDINKGIEEANKAKNNKNAVKKKKKKNYSLGENIFNLIKKNINNNGNNENIKKNKKKLIELLNNNNIKKKIKNNSIKKKLFYVGHQNTNLNLNGVASTVSPMTSNTNRYSQKRNIIKENLNKKNKNPNNNLTSNKTYKKRKLLSYGNEDVKKLINSQNHKSPKGGINNTNTNMNNNYLNTINTNTIYSYKKLNEMQKINSPLSINRKTLNSNNNTNSILTSINTNHNTNKIKICKTLKNFGDKNKNKKNVSKNTINKDLIIISGEKKRKISKFSYKKLDIDNLTETQIFKEKHINKKVKGRNIVSPPNNKYIESYTNDNTSINNNLPFSANKNKNPLNNGKIFSDKVMLNNLSYQTINYEQGVYHQRTKSNLVQNNFKKNMNSNPIFSKVIITDSNKAYIKPAIRIKKKDKLFMSRPILIDTNADSNYENKTSVNNIGVGSKKLFNNTNSLNNFPINNTNTSNEFKNNLIYNNNIKNTNFNKYLLDVIKKNKHQHYNSLTRQINPIHSLNPKDNILVKNKKKLTNNTKGNKDRDVLQIALSLFLNENASRNIQNSANIMEQNTANLNNFNTYYKINNNRPANKNNNNQKRNYNLNININNEININGNNNNINNSAYSINDTHRLNNKNLSRNNNKNNNYLKNYEGNNSKQKDKEKDKDKLIINLKQKKYNVDPPVNTNRNNNCQSSKNNNANENVATEVNNKKGKKLKTRNVGNKNYNNVLTSINNNYVNTIILNNNTVDNNRYIDINKISNINNKNNNIIKSYHTKSVTSISDLMYHNKRLITLYKNLSNSK